MTPIARGVLLAVLAAATFGATPPFVHRLAVDASPPATAALLYAGAVAFATLPRARTSEVRLGRAWGLRVLAVGLVGAFVAPVALAFGLHRTSGTTASLLLNLEAVFTVVLGGVIYREPIGGRVAAAAALIAGGGAMVALEPGGAALTGWIGPLAVAAAALAWAVDNTLSRPLSDFDPNDVVAAKGLVGVAASLTLAALTGATWPHAWAAAGLLACGAVGIGASLRLYLLAQRTLGAARTGSVFAIAPFLGALTAMAMGEPLGGALAVLGGVAMAAGVALHLGEDHDHEHAHEATRHEHPHRHDDGHHEHRHEPTVVGMHSHVHEHGAVIHQHPHGEDVHHRHPH